MYASGKQRDVIPCEHRYTHPVLMNHPAVGTLSHRDHLVRILMGIVGLDSCQPIAPVARRNATLFFNMVKSWKTALDENKAHMSAVGAAVITPGASAAEKSAVRPTTSAAAGLAVRPSTAAAPDHRAAEALAACAHEAGMEPISNTSPAAGELAVLPWRPRARSCSAGMKSNMSPGKSVSEADSMLSHVPGEATWIKASQL